LAIDADLIAFQHGTNSVTYRWKGTIS